MAAKKPKAATSSPKKTIAVDDDIAVHVLAGLRADRGSEDVAMFVGSDEMAFKIRGVISTQVPTLDEALGRGGYPLGRLTIIYGKEGSGKTTLLLHAIAETQSQGGLAILFDKEYTLDPEYAAKLGVNVDRLIISQDGSLEEVIEMMHSIITRAVEWRERHGRRVPILIGLDSINAAIAKCRLEGNPGDAHMAPEARIWSAELPKLLKRAYHEDIALVFISQIRSKMNVQFGDPDDIAGGHAPKFYASILLKVTPTGATRETAAGDKTTGEDKDAIKVGYMAQAEAKKNKIAPPFRKATFAVRYGQGADFHHSLITACVANDIIEKSGAWFSHGGERIGQGAINAAKVLADNPDWTARIAAEFRAKKGWVYEDPAAIEHSAECLASGAAECVDDCPVAAWFAAHPEAVPPVAEEEDSAPDDEADVDAA